MDLELVICLLRMLLMVVSQSINLYTCLHLCLSSHFLFFIITCFFSCSASRRTLCNSTISAARDGFRWHARKHKSTSSYSWKCSCSRRAASGKYGPIESIDFSLSYSWNPRKCKTSHESWSSPSHAYFYNLKAWEHIFRFYL